MNPRRLQADQWYSPERIRTELDRITVPARLVIGARQIPTEARQILDLGCGTGALGRLIRDKRQFRPLGVDFSAAAAAAAQPYYTDVPVLDLEHDSLPFAPASLDAVVAIDVLEQLGNPAAVLALLRPLLKPTGRLIGSIRNVRNQDRIRQLLYNGRGGRQAHEGMAGTAAAWTLRDFGDLLAASGYWFEGPVYATQAPLGDDITSLVTFLAAQGLDREKLMTELATTEYVFAVRPDPAPSGRLMVLHVADADVTWAQAQVEIDPRTPHGVTRPAQAT